MGHHTTKKTQHQLGATVDDKGVNFCVWAPFAASVSVLVGEPYNWTETVLTREDDTWCGFVDEATPGQGYLFQITDADGNVFQKNDPRARQLSASEEGFSIIVDSHFDWEDVEAPLRQKNEHIIYELHVGTFHRPDASTLGTFTSAIEKLDYLKDLGVTTIELMPVTSMSTSYGWGYAPHHLFSVENSYGGRHGLLSFVKEAHARGLSVILDVVYNHFFPTTDLWRFDGWSENDGGGIYFYNDDRVKTPWGGRPDYGRPEVRQFLLDNVAMWLADYRLDGLRIDSTIYMRNTRGPEGDESTAIPEALSLLQEIAELGRSINPRSLIVAEDSSVEPSLTDPQQIGCDAQWGLAFPHTVRAFLGLEKAEYGNTLAGELLHTYNNDPFQKVVFSDSHDTAANGSVRLNEAVTPGNASSVFARHHTLLANALTLTTPGIPLLLQGSEFLQEGAFTDWQALEWDKAQQFSGIVLAHQHLTALRRNAHGNSAGLLGAHTAIIHDNPADGVIGFHRWDNGGPGDDVVVIASASDQSFAEYTVVLPRPGSWSVRFTSSWKGYSPEFQDLVISSVTAKKDGSAVFALPPQTVIILGQDAN